MSSVEASTQFAKKYLEDILSFFGLNADVQAVSSDGEVIELSIPSTHLNGFLIGHNGETMRALQFLVGSALKNQDFAIARVSVDVADYKKQRADRMIQKAEEWVSAVRATNEPVVLPAMNATDRRTVHQYASEQGLLSESAGEGMERHIILKPAV